MVFKLKYFSMLLIIILMAGCNSKQFTINIDMKNHTIEKARQGYFAISKDKLEKEKIKIFGGNGPCLINTVSSNKDGVTAFSITELGSLRTVFSKNNTVKHYIVFVKGKKTNYVDTRNDIAFKIK